MAPRLARKQATRPMKRQWETDELVEQWTLLPRDLALLANKTGPTRLGFAALLLYFQHEGRFPQHRHEVPRPVVAHIAAQVGVAYEEWLRYDWDSRSIRYHRVQIREALGYREASIQDADDLAAWLSAHVVARIDQHAAGGGSAVRGDRQGDGCHSPGRGAHPPVRETTRAGDSGSPGPCSRPNGLQLGGEGCRAKVTLRSA